MGSLRPEQEVAVEFMERNKRIILADPPGWPGKTPPTLVWLEQLQTPAPGSFLIVAPNTDVARQWIDQGREWAPSLSMHDYSGAPRDRIEAHFRYLDDKRPRALVTTYSLLRTDPDVFVRPWDATVFDEGHRLKTRDAQQTKAAWKVAHRTKHLALLTGSPILNSAEELWSYLHMVAPKQYTSFWRWARLHFYIEVKDFRKGRNTRGPQQLTQIVGALKPGHDEAIRAELAAVLIQRDEEMTGPPPNEVQINVELSEAERKHYEDLADRGWTRFADGTVLQTDGELSKKTRLRQMTQDWTALWEADAPSSKVSAALDVLTSITSAGHKAVLFSTLKPPTRSIEEHAKGRHLPPTWHYNGDISNAQRAKALAEFKAAPEGILLGTIDSMREGIDGLQHSCHNVVMFDRSYVPEYNNQSIRRVFRHGQTKPVNVFHLYAADSEDAEVATINTRKIKTIEAIRGRPVDVFSGRELAEVEVDAG